MNKRKIRSPSVAIALDDGNVEDFRWRDLCRPYSLDQHDVILVVARERGLVNETDTRLRWQLLGQLDDDELLIQIPEWLAEENIGYVDDGTPTEFVGRIERETEKAILFADSASARRFMRLAHRITISKRDQTMQTPDR